MPYLALSPEVIAREYLGKVEQIPDEQPVFDVVAVTYNALTLLE